MKQAIVIRSPYRHVMQEIGKRIVIDKRAQSREIIAPAAATAAPLRTRSRLAATDEACQTMDTMIADSRATLQRSGRRDIGKATA